jgi:hypothetical protein
MATRPILGLVFLFGPIRPLFALDLAAIKASGGFLAVSPLLGFAVLLNNAEP